jgi:hypothetical protein
VLLGFVLVADDAIDEFKQFYLHAWKFNHDLFRDVVFSI